MALLVSLSLQKCIWNIDVVFQVDLLIFYTPPQTLYEDIVPETPTTIPADLDVRCL